MLQQKSNTETLIHSIKTALRYKAESVYNKIESMDKDQLDANGIELNKEELINILQVFYYFDKYGLKNNFKGHYQNRSLFIYYDNAFISLNYDLDPDYELVFNGNVLKLSSFNYFKLFISKNGWIDLHLHKKDSGSKTLEFFSIVASPEMLTIK